MQLQAIFFHHFQISAYHSQVINVSDLNLFILRFIYTPILIYLFMCLIYSSIFNYWFMCFIYSRYLFINLFILMYLNKYLYIDWAYFCLLFSDGFLFTGGVAVVGFLFTGLLLTDCLLIFLLLWTNRRYTYTLIQAIIVQINKFKRLIQENDWRSIHFNVNQIQDFEKWNSKWRVDVLKWHYRYSSSTTAAKETSSTEIRHLGSRVKCQGGAENWE